MVSAVEVAAIALLAGAATGIGALPILVAGQVSHRTYDGALGLAAGIMVGAAVFALLVPGLELGSLGAVSGGFLLGGAFLLVANWVIPHTHLLFGDATDEVLPESEPVDETDDGLRWAVLIGSSITIHNVPEGLAIGIAFASGLDGVGVTLAVAIAIQNIPDGFAMAVPADQAGVSKAKTILYTTLSGAAPEPIAAVAGFLLVALVTGL